MEQKWWVTFITANVKLDYSDSTEHPLNVKLQSKQITVLAIEIPSLSRFHDVWDTSNHEGVVLYDMKGHGEVDVHSRAFPTLVLHISRLVHFTSEKQLPVPTVQEVG
jgi:hypothetical protein